jgi:hypothetical protein
MGAQGYSFNLENGFEFLRGAGSCEEEALSVDAPERDQGGCCHFGFDSLGDGLQAEGVSEADDGPDYRQVVGVVS